VLLHADRRTERHSEASRPVFVCLPGKTIPLGKPSFRREDNIEMNLKEIRCDIVHLSVSRQGQWQVFRTL
jgi:hypothetical protein